MGCPAHAEILYTVETQKILPIRGLLLHNDACHGAELTDFPRRNLHPSEFAVALQQLQDGSSLDEIQTRNRQMHKTRKYEGQPSDLSNSPYRWLLKPYDTRSLYRQYNRMQGIKVTEAAHVNIHLLIKECLRRVEQDLLETVTYESALGIVTDATTALESVLQDHPGLFQKGKLNTYGLTGCPRTSGRAGLLTVGAMHQSYFAVR